MTPEDKQAWCKALLSGHYPQGKYYLESHGYWCCLGVACDVFEQDFQEDTDGELPEPLRKRLGLDKFGSLPKPIKHNGVTHYNLVSLNDKADFTFAQIAAVIDEQF